VVAEPAEFYDRRYAEVGESKAERYQPLYAAAAALIPDAADVMELGCGSGGFAALICDRTYYWGLDFAPGLIEAARQRLPNAVFEVADLRTAVIPRADVYVALEVLEHLDDDLGLLARLPRGARVVLSVPSFDSASHVRFFAASGSARARYRVALAIDHEQEIPLRRGAFFHLLAGVVR
jgi:trans-aconitate methyltransferase